MIVSLILRFGKKQLSKKVSEYHHSFDVLSSFSVSVAAINSNGLLEFSHPQQEQHQYITNQVPLENFKTGTTNSNLLVAAQTGKSNVSGATAPARETKGILKIFYI